MIPITKLSLGQDEFEEVKKALISGWVMMGPKTEEFEKEVADYVGNKFAVAVSSGTGALYLALKALDIKPGDEVITPTYSFVSSAYVINLCGAKPVFCDVDLETYNMTVKNIEGKITPKTRAIIVVDQFGLSCDLDPIMALAKKHHLEIIEDAACALGSEYKNKKIGSRGKFVCFSFHPRKIITTGEGGMVVTNNLKIAEKIRLLRNHGLLKDRMTSLGFNLRITDIQSAVGLNQLKKIGQYIEKRRQKAQIYTQSFLNNPFFAPPQEPSYTMTNYQSYAVVLHKKYARLTPKIIANLRQKGIGAKIGIIPIHKQPFYHQKTTLPNSEYLGKASILLPIYPTLSNTEQKYIISTLLQEFNGLR